MTGGPEAILDAGQNDTVSDVPFAVRPADVPEKFWDAEEGTLRTETLLKSYLELERKLGTMIPMPTTDDPASRDKLQRVLGKPATPDGYQINTPHELITPDPAINSRLHEAGLSSEQAQLVYDLAAEHLVPLVEEANREARGRVERSQLAAHFGGEDKWQSIAPQIKTWAEANLSDEVYGSLGSSADGVIAIYHMMQTREPNVISEAAVPVAAVDERQLSQMMRDPRYWRDRDPALVAEVTAGYQRLFD
ncbi:MAG: hypothetical protein HC871_00115 [Rhizobiales bacterium]|nr:hypothetical protein [Hyphomicrobiales bacterium]